MRWHMPKRRIKMIPKLLTDATILARLGKWKEARREAERALEIQPRLQSAQQLLQRIDQAIRDD